MFPCPHIPRQKDTKIQAKLELSPVFCWDSRYTATDAVCAGGLQSISGSMAETMSNSMDTRNKGQKGSDEASTSLHGMGKSMYRLSLFPFRYPMRLIRGPELLRLLLSVPGGRPSGGVGLDYLEMGCMGQR